MALTDVNFQEGEGQDFLIEVPSASYVGAVTDIVVEAGGAQYSVVEVPEAEGGNVFIISE